MAKKGTIAYGAWNALANGLKLKAQENLLIITEEEQASIAQEFKEQADQIGAKTTIRTLEDYGRPLKRLPDQLEEDLGKTQVAIFAASGQPGELDFRFPLIDRIEKLKIRYGHGIGLNETIMLTGMQADVEETNSRVAQIHERLRDSQSVRIESQEGTDITIIFSREADWLVDDWNINEDRWHNIPPGEAYTTPKNAHGVYVVDGVLGDHFDEKYGSLKRTPVRYEVNDNRITSVSCDNKELEQELIAYLDSGPQERTIGELGIGALDVDDVVGKMLQDEKILGTVHIAHGNNLGHLTGAEPNGAKTHCDGVIMKPTLTTDSGDVIIKDGEYQPPKQ